MSLQVMIYLFLFLFFPFSMACSEEAREHHITVYGAVMTDGALSETAVFTASLDRHFKFAAIAAGKKIGNLLDRIDFELEGQIVKQTAGQHHWKSVIIAKGKDRVDIHWGFL